MPSSLAIGLLLNYRDAARSVCCIRSLLQDGVERIVVWDNSADGGQSATEIKNTFCEDTRIRIVVSDKNVGFAAGVNRGLEECVQMDPRARILLINNDAYLFPGAVSSLNEALEVNRDAKIAIPNINHAGKVVGYAYYNRIFGLLAFKSRRYYFPYPSGCCILLAADRITFPLFDEDFFMYGEDWELGWRLHRIPGSMTHVDETLVQHDGSASSGLGTLFYETQVVAAHIILVAKLAQGRAEAMLLYSLRVPMLLCRATLRSFRFGSITPWVALVKGFRIVFTNWCTTRNAVRRKIKS